MSLAQSGRNVALRPKPCRPALQGVVGVNDVVSYAGVFWLFCK